MANMARKASDQDIGAGIILTASANFTSEPTIIKIALEIYLLGTK